MIFFNRKKKSDMPVNETVVQEQNWDQPFDLLREKWVDVPFDTMNRINTATLAGMSDEVLLKIWEKSALDFLSEEKFSQRGWYHELYGSFLKGKKILDIGSGMAYDTIQFAKSGAEVTFLDLAESNLDVLRRICKIQGIHQVHFHHLKNVSSLQSLPNDFDVMMALGSLHHAPQKVIQAEVHELFNHLKVGGRWIQLAYPKARWEREGSKPFSQWGVNTDGERTPWAEWYDLEKLLKLFSPARFDTVFYYEFYDQNFNWFDLVLRERAHPGA